MIFIVTGTQKFQMNRLLKQMDNLVEEGKIQEEVYAQIGNSDYIPKHYSWSKFLKHEEFEEKMESCDKLVTHSGVGSILSGITKRKPVIVVPRLKKYGEHVDDHQVQIAEAFSEKNYVLLCTEKDDLGEVLQECENHRFERYVSNRSRVISTVRRYLDSI